MIIVMEPGTSEDNIQRVVKILEKKEMNKLSKNQMKLENAER